MINKILQGLLTTVLAVTMMCPYAPAYAEELDTPEDPILIDEYGTNYLITMCAGEIDDDDPFLTCELTQGTPQCTVFASIANNDVPSGTLVDCYFILPSGTSYSLGSLLATGGQSFTLNFYYLVPGVYKFYFETSCTEPLEVSGFIYI